MADIPQDFLAFLQSEEARSYDSTLLSDVEAAIDSYNGQPYGDEEDGRSQVVSRDVAETADYMLTSIMDVMAGSDRLVEFEPTAEGEEDVCDDATEAMHYIYRRKSGYRTIHDWAKAGLLEKVAIVKSCVERKRKRVERTIPAMVLPGETEEELRANGIVASEEAGEHPEFGPMVNIATIEETAAEFPDYFVPLEEFRISPEARDLDSAVYLAHVTKKTISELVEMGFDADTLEGINDGGDPLYGTLSMARDDGRSITLDTNRSGALREVWLREEYPLFDLNGDGIAERLCVHRVGNTVLVRDGQLAIDEVDYQPFEYWCPYPMQGRFVGQSLADKTMDIQRVNTVVERNLLDGTYHNLKPRPLLHEDAIGDHTLDDLLTVYPGAPIRWKGAIPPTYDRPNDMTATALQVLEFKMRQRESRTGITRLNKGVDEDTLNDTASGQKMLMTRGQQMERYIVRNFAEGVARLFMKKIGLMRRYGQPFTIRVDGEYRQVDPSQWPESMEVNVKVGLGSGSKDERLAHRNMIAQAQTLLMQAQAPICTWENVFNNLSAAARDAGLQPNDLFTHPDDAPPQEPPPDPKVLALQAQVQQKQAQLQQQAQDNQAKLAMMAQKHASDAQIAQAKAEMEAHLAVRQQDLEAWLNAQELVMNAHKHAADADAKVQIAKMRPGGRIDK